MWRWIVCGVGLLGCTAPSLQVVSEPLAGGGAGIAGTPGPFGVGRTSWRGQVRVTESSIFEVHVPVLADGELADGPFPAVLFVHGGLVGPGRYRWWAEHVASRGYVVVTATHPSDLAIFAQGTSGEALDAVRNASQNENHPLFGAVDPRAPAAVTGHSLGGVVAARAFVENPQDFSTLGIIASFPAGWDDLSERAGDPVLSIVGANDGSADLQRVRDAILAQPDPRLYAVVDGFNHYDWADDVSAEELAKDGERARPVAEARTDAMRVMDTWLDGWMTADAEAQDRWFNSSFSGVEVTR
ncbi:MAG: alpha/beta hydrolase [Myxococcota bacterium]